MYFAKFAILGVFISSAFSQLRPDCRLDSDPDAEVGRPAELRLSCPSDLEFTVSWQSGDGSAAGAYGAETLFRHTYFSEGRFLVFARVKVGGNLHPFSTWQAVRTPQLQHTSRRSASMFLDPATHRLWVANPDNHTVTAIDAKEFTRLWEVPVGAHPGFLQADDQGRIWVSCRDEASIHVLEGETGKLLQRIALPRASRPQGLVLNPEAGMAWVALEATGEVVRLDLSSGTILQREAVGPTPFALALSPDGTSLFVTRLISSDDGGEVWELQSSNLEKIRTISLAYDPGPDTESSGRGLPNYLLGISLSPDGKWAVVAGKKDNIRKGTLRSGETPNFESTVRAMVSQISLDSHLEQIDRRLDLNNHNLPSDAVFTSNGEFLFVVSQGSNSVDIFDMLTNKPVVVIEPRSLRDELGSLSVALSGDTLLFVHNFLSRQVAVYDLKTLGGTNRMERRALIALVKQENMSPTVLRGKQIFYNSADPRMARDGYVSCASCHLDGRSDGRTWDFSNRGEGLRNTHSLRGRAGTGHGPLHWSANFDEIQDFEHDIRGPQEGSGFLPDSLFNAGTRNQPLGDRKAGLSPDLDALAAYVASLDSSLPSPWRASDGSLSPAARSGEKIFNRPDVGCAVCHAPPAYTLSRLPSGAEARVSPQLPGGAQSVVMPEGFLVYDVGTWTDSSGQRLKGPLKGFDTPGLKGIWESSPYLHDGSAATLMDVITTRNRDDRHGVTSQLSAREKEDLVAFLLQLDETQAVPNTVYRPRVSSERRAAPWLPVLGLHLPTTAPQPMVPLRNPVGRRVPGSASGFFILENRR